MPASTFRMHLRGEYLSLIRSGSKIYEGRLAEPEYDDIAPGTIIAFHSDTEELRVVVESKTHHASFREMLSAYGVSAFLPFHSDLDEAVELYRGFPGYREGEGVYGAYAMKVKVFDEAK